jgi:nitric oxide reductase subunit C
MKKKMSILFVFILVLSVILTACGGGGGETDATVDAGKELFAQTVVGSDAGCITCHSLTEGEVIVGPSMAGIGSRAGSTVAGQSAEDYLRESILNPDAHLVDEFPAGTMPQVWGDVLSNEQVDQLVAYLLTLK